MNRRTFVRTVAGSAVVVWVPQVFARTTVEEKDSAERLDKAAFRKLADVALQTAKRMGASYADIRVCRYQNQSISTREERVERIDESRSEERRVGKECRSR